MDYNSTENQKIKGKLVEQEVICGVNEVIELLQKCEEHDYQEEVINVTSQPNYEEACRYHLFTDTTNSELVEIAVELCILDEEEKECKFINSSVATEIIKASNIKASDYMSVLHLLIENALLDESDDLFHRKELAQEIVSDEDFDHKEFSEENSLSYDYLEAYEFYNVSGFLGQKLKERGEIVENILGFTVWGRCTSGQAILLDDVISKIAEDMEILEGMKYSWTDNK